MPRRRLIAWTALATLVAAIAIGTAVGVAVMRGGLYDVAATSPHTQWVYTLLERAFEYSVRRRATAIDTPALIDPALLARGAVCFRDHCVACHGAPGVAPGVAALAMQPAPGPLVDAAARWRPREVYWITRHGIRMTGMPAWGHRLNDADLWAVTAWVAQMPGWSAARWRTWRDEAGAAECGLRP